MRVFHSAGKKVYFTLLASSFMFPISAFAQCVETDCNTLGYDSPTSCDNGIKCPFGEYWACPEPAKPEEPEAAVLGQCTGYAKSCKIGDILNSDGTCTSDKISGKKPIAVVGYIDPNGCGQALALEDSDYAWWCDSEDWIDVPGLDNLTKEQAENDFNSCENTKKILAVNYVHRAAESASKYAPSGAVETLGKWCLPAAGVFNAMRKYAYEINVGMAKAMGCEVSYYGYWTSSEVSECMAWEGSLRGEIDYTQGNCNKARNSYVRPVIEF